MSRDNERIVNFLSKALREDETVIRDLYSQTISEVEGDSEVNQIKDDILNQMLRAAFLIRIAEKQDTISVGNSDTIIPYHFLKGTIQLSLLISAVETVGTPSKYFSFNEWMNREFFPNKNQDCYTDKEINKAWNKYKEHYGASKSFRDVILESELDTLLTKFLLSEVIMLFEGTDETKIPYETIQLKDAKNPEDFVPLGVHIHHQGMEYILFKDSTGYVISEYTGKKRRQIVNLAEIEDYFIYMKKLRPWLDIVQLKRDSIKKYLKPKLNFLYHIRSGYYHTGELPVSKRTDFVALGPWTYRQKTYLPLIKRALITQFQEISRKAITSSWRQKIMILINQSYENSYVTTE